MVAPAPELPDDTPIERVIFSTRIQNALIAADLKTVGEVREASDETLISLPDFGKVRKKLGLPSTDGVRAIEIEARGNSRPYRESDRCTVKMTRMT